MCSLCGPSRTPYWFCGHCWLSLCAYCYGHATAPGFPGTLPPESPFLATPTVCTDHRQFPRGGPLDRFAAGCSRDRSILHLPVAVVEVRGLGDKRSGGAEADALRDLWRTRSYQLTPGYGAYPYLISLPNRALTQTLLQKKVGDVVEQLRSTVAVRHIIDCRAHRSAEGRFLFGAYSLDPNQLVSYLLGPLLDACEYARRRRDTAPLGLADSRLAGDDHRPPLVILACCDTDGASLAGALDRWFARDGNVGSSCELLVFCAPLLLSDFPLLQPQLFGRYCDARMLGGTLPLLQHVLSEAFLQDYKPELWAPDSTARLQRHFVSSEREAARPTAAAVAARGPVAVPVAAPASLVLRAAHLHETSFGVWASVQPEAAMQLIGPVAQTCRTPVLPPLRGHAIAVFREQLDCLIPVVHQHAPAILFGEAAPLGQVASLLTLSHKMVERYRRAVWDVLFARAELMRQLLAPSPGAAVPAAPAVVLSMSAAASASAALPPLMPPTRAASFVPFPALPFGASQAIRAVSASASVVPPLLVPPARAAPFFSFPLTPPGAPLPALPPPLSASAPASPRLPSLPTPHSS